jgi:hypothetical protein
LFIYRKKIVEIPRNAKESLNLDQKNKDCRWSEAMKKEKQGIQSHGAFLFLPPGGKPPEGFPEATLRRICDTKPDLRRKISQS